MSIKQEVAQQLRDKAPKGALLEGGKLQSMYITMHTAADLLDPPPPPTKGYVAILESRLDGTRSFHAVVYPTRKEAEAVGIKHNVVGVHELVYTE